MENWLIFLISVFFGGILGGIIGVFLKNWSQKAEINAIWLELENLTRRISIFKSVEKNVKAVEQNSRLEDAIAEAAAMYATGKKPDEILKALAPKYPDVAINLFKQFKEKHI